MLRFAATKQKSSSTSHKGLLAPAQIMAKRPIATGARPPRAYKTILATSVGLALSIPASFVFGPVVPNTILLFALPPHVYLGVSHVVEDYLVGQNPSLWGIVCAVIILLALLRLQLSGSGLVQVIGELFSK